jgi:hypothetical protein
MTEENKAEKEETTVDQSKLNGMLSCDFCDHKAVCKVLPEVKEVITKSGVVIQTPNKTWPLASWLGVVLANYCQYSE